MNHRAVKPWTTQRLAQWENIRRQGKRRFIWNHGVFQWGGFMFFFSLAFFQYQRYGSMFSMEGNLPFRLLFGALIWIFVGYLYGQSRWRRNEQEYLRQAKETGRS